MRSIIETQLRTLNKFNEALYRTTSNGATYHKGVALLHAALDEAENVLCGAPAAHLDELMVRVEGVLQELRSFPASNGSLPVDNNEDYV